MPNYIYDQLGNPVGYISGNYIHTLHGQAIGQISGTNVHKMSGEYVGEIHDKIRYLIGRINLSHKIGGQADSPQRR